MGRPGPEASSREARGPAPRPRWHHCDSRLAPLVAAVQHEEPDDCGDAGHDEIEKHRGRATDVVQSETVHGHHRIDGGVEDEGLLPTSYTVRDDGAGEREREERAGGAGRIVER